MIIRTTGLTVIDALKFMKKTKTGTSFGLNDVTILIGVDEDWIK